jgi:hypothetical protein
MDMTLEEWAATEYGRGGMTVRQIATLLGLGATGGLYARLRSVRDRMADAETADGSRGQEPGEQPGVETPVSGAQGPSVLADADGDGAAQERYSDECSCPKCAHQDCSDNEQPCVACRHSYPCDDPLSDALPNRFEARVDGPAAVEVELGDAAAKRLVDDVVGPADDDGTQEVSAASLVAFIRRCGLTEKAALYCAGYEDARAVV